jgi:urea transport system substrate-binding protein
MKLKNITQGLACIITVISALSSITQSYAQDTIKVGILHSLSGTMAISEITLKDTILMMVDDVNNSGGLLGKKLEAVVVDPKSDWPTFGGKARELLTKDKVDVIFGCWTSVSRKHVKPVVEELNGLLFYPVQYEGQEESPNIFYTGATPNQQALPAIDYLMSKEGGSAKRFYLAATDYVYPRTTNEIIKAYLKTKGVAEDDIKESYTDFGNKDWADIVKDIKKFGSESKKTVVVSTINGDANTGFYNELTKQSISSKDIPVVAFSVGEQELSGIDTSPLVGHLASWNYFMSIESEENQKFISKWNKFIKSDQRVTNDPMEASYIGFSMWVEAVKKANSTKVVDVTKALAGITVKSPSGFLVKMDEVNHHLHKPVFIGEIQPDGQMEIVWKSDNIVEPKNWSPYIGKNYVEKGGKIIPGN